MTNEERFIASCEMVGEADVRTKLSAGRYSELKTPWATRWLESVESGKSDFTKEEEASSRLHDLRRTKDRFATLKVVLVIVLLLAILIAFFILG